MTIAGCEFQFQDGTKCCGYHGHALNESTNERDHVHYPRYRWQHEFSEEYAVPQEIHDLLDTGDLEDASWHNDTCPSFVLKGDPSPETRIWVEHPDPEAREVLDDNDVRFMVTEFGPDNTDTVRAFGTDDINEAIATLREWRATPILESLPYHVGERIVSKSGEYRGVIEEVRIDPDLKPLVVKADRDGGLYHFHYDQVTREEA